MLKIATTLIVYIRVCILLIPIAACNQTGMGVLYTPFPASVIGGKHIDGYALTADRRLIVASLDNTNSQETVCTESPPDVAVVSAKLIQASLDISADALGQKVLSPDAKLGYNSQTASAIQQLVQISQGLQLYRNGLFFICQTRLNDPGLSNSTIVNWEHSIRTTAAALILAQANNLPNVAQLVLNVVPPTNISAQGGAVKPAQTTTNPSAIAPPTDVTPPPDAAKPAQTTTKPSTTVSPTDATPPSGTTRP